MTTRALNFSIGKGSLTITGNVDTAIETLIYMDVAYTDLVNASLSAKVGTSVTSTSKTEAFLNASTPVTTTLQGITFRSITPIVVTTDGPVGDDGPRPPGAA